MIQREVTGDHFLKQAADDPSTLLPMGPVIYRCVGAIMSNVPSPPYHRLEPWSFAPHWFTRSSAAIDGHLVDAFISE